MEHRLDIKSGKNEFDRQLRNFRVHVHRDDEGENVAVIRRALWLSGTFRNISGPAEFRPP
jgi:hypothetical protein